MRTHLSYDIASRFYRVLSIVGTGLILSCASAVDAQVFSAYSFEPDLQGFAGNPAGASITVSLETSGLGATVGPNSMKVALADFAGFVGAQTANLHTAITDGGGLDFLRFDLTNTNRYVPPMPVPGQTPTFADTSVTFFGEFADAPGDEAQIQFVGSQEAIGTLEPGTHEIEIDLTQGGLWTQGGQFKGYTDFVEDGFIPFSWQIYFNKNVRFMGGPTWAWTVYVDNIRLVRDVAGLPGDYNEDGKVDAADYVRWRANETANSPLPNDNGLTTQSERFDLWRGNFGEMTMPGGGAGAVPEPTSALLLIMAAVFYWSKKRG